MLRVSFCHILPIERTNIHTLHTYTPDASRLQIASITLQDLKIKKHIRTQVVCSKKNEDDFFFSHPSK